MVNAVSNEHDWPYDLRNEHKDNKCWILGNKCQILKYLIPRLASVKVPNTRSSTYRGSDKLIEHS